MAIEIRTLLQLNDVRDILNGEYILMNNIDASWTKLSNVEALPLFETRLWNEGEFCRIESDDSLYWKVYEANEDTIEDPRISSNWNIIWEILKTDNEGWVPIGSSLTRFTGEFDCNEFIISKLYINNPTIDYVGFFGATSDANIKIRFIDSYITGKDRVGGIVGDNGHSSGSESNIYDSYFLGDILGNQYVGGICGRNNRYGRIRETFFKGTVSSSSIYVGGFVGYNYNGGEIENSYNIGDIIASSSYRGGFCGRQRNETGVEPHIINCFSVPTGGTSSGVAGFCEINNATILNCFFNNDLAELTIGSGGTSLTSIQIKTLNTFTDVNWDFPNIILLNECYVLNPEDANINHVWYILSENYPKLMWEKIEIPNLINTNISENIIQCSGFLVGDISYKYSKSIDQNKILEQSIDETEQYPYGTDIDINVSMGNNIKTYFASYERKGSGDGTSIYNSFLISDFWNIFIPGDTLLLDDGIYKGSESMITPTNGVKGDENFPTEIKAVNDGSVFINGEGENKPIYLINNDWFIIEGINVFNSNGSVVTLSNSSNNKLKRIIGWDAYDGNTNIFGVHSNSNNNLIEDCAGFGIARKIFSNSQMGNYLTLRRCFGRWEGSHYNGPKMTFTMAYNSYNAIYENCIGTWDAFRMDKNYLLKCSDENTYSKCNTLFENYEVDQPYGIFSRDRNDGDKDVNSYLLGSIAYVKDGQKCEGIPSLINISSLNKLYIKNSTAFASNEFIALYLSSFFKWEKNKSYTQIGEESSRGVIPTIYNGHYYIPLTTGVTSETQPIWPENGGTVEDGEVIWKDAGEIDLLIQNFNIFGTKNISNWNIENLIEEGDIYAENEANINFQYIDGVQTNVPLWPWPMDQRIYDAMTFAGYSNINGEDKRIIVTYEIKSIFLQNILSDIYENIINNYNNIVSYPYNNQTYISNIMLYMTNLTTSDYDDIINMFLLFSQTFSEMQSVLIAYNYSDYNLVPSVRVINRYFKEKIDTSLTDFVNSIWIDEVPSNWKYLCQLSGEDVSGWNS